MRCNQCGTENAAGVNFCTSCGSKLNQDGANPTPVMYQDPVQPTSNPGQGFAIAGMVCGIVSFFFFGYITGTLGIIFGCVAKSKGNKSGMATAGIVCGAIAIALSLLGTLFLGSLFAAIY